MGDVIDLLSTLGSGAYLTTPRQYEKMKKYASDLEQPSTKMNEAVRVIENNLKWAETNIPIIINFIEQYI